MVCRDLASYIVRWTAVPGWRTGVVYVCAGSTWPVTNISCGKRGLSGWQRSWSSCWNCKYIENQLVSAATSRRGRPGGGGVLKKFNRGRLRPKVRPLTRLYTTFGRKDAPFVYLPLTNGTPFVYLPNRKSSCHFYAAFNKSNQYIHKVCVFEIF